MQIHWQANSLRAAQSICTHYSGVDANRNRTGRNSKPADLECNRMQSNRWLPVISNWSLKANFTSCVISRKNHWAIWGPGPLGAFICWALLGTLGAPKLPGIAGLAGLPGFAGLPGLAGLAGPSVASTPWVLASPSSDAACEPGPGCSEFCGNPRTWSRLLRSLRI